MHNTLDFTLLSRLEKGDRIKVTSERFGELVLVRDARLGEYNPSDHYCFYSFYDPEGGEGLASHYSLYLWVELDPSAPLESRDEQMSQKATSCSIKHTLSKINSLLVGLERIR
jgi:hypothetical protein